MKKSQSVENIDSIIANENIADTDLKSEMENCMLSYAVMVIVMRALPDIRDGMKPVQRRILYCCKEAGFDVTKPYVKCAKIDGAVSGNFHPHGSCYGTIANMAQNWTYRYPLMDFHGNVGSLDGDPPAASRYTESRLAHISYEILEDVMDKHSVPFQPNYSETMDEPVILPGLFPDFLANGADGIAVGYTTNVPSHNLNELCDGIIYAVKNKDCTTKDLMKVIKGPDFPYGSIMSKSGLETLYETGQGKLSFRASYTLEENNENGNPQIVFTDLPPKSDKPKLIEKIYGMINDKSLPRTVAVRDESKGIDIRIVIECQKTANVPLLIQDLYAKTNLQKNETYIMRGIVGTELKLVTLRKYMDIYLEHRRKVLTDRYNYMLETTNAKLNIQQGLTKVIDDIKKAVNIIIDSDNAEIAKETIKTKYGLNDIQADYILEKKVRTLVKLDRDKIFDLIKELLNNVQTYIKILNDENELDKVIISQLEELKKKFGDKRRTKIVDSFDCAQVANEPINENVVCVLNNNGNFIVYEEEEVKAVSEKGYKDKSNVFRQYMPCKRSDELIIINKNGMCERVAVADLQYNTSKFADAINFIHFNIESENTLISVLSNGNVKKTLINKMKFKKNKPTQIIKDLNSEIVVNKVVEDKKEEIITIATNKGYIGRFSCNSFMATACGSKAMNCNKLEDGDFVVDCKISLENDDKENKL